MSWKDYRITFEYDAPYSDKIIMTRVINSNKTPEEILANEHKQEKNTFVDEKTLKLVGS